MILDSIWGILVLGMERILHAHISEAYTKSLHEYRASIDTIPRGYGLR